MIKLNNVEKAVKRFIKRKVSVTLATMVVFLMTGAFVFSTTTTTTDPGENSATLRERVGALETRVNGLADRINNTTVDTTTFATKTELTNGLATKAEATALDGKLDKTEAETTYAKKTDLDAEKTAREEMDTKLKAAHDDLVNAVDTFNKGQVEFNNVVDAALDTIDDSLTEIDEKIVAGKVTSTSLTVGGTGKVVEADITVDLTDETKAEIAKIEGKLDKTEFIEKSAKIQEELDANKQAIAEEKTIREGAVTALNERVAKEETARAEAITAEKTARETADEEIKIQLAKKADATALEGKLDKTTFETFTTKLEEAMTPTLAAVGELGKGMTELTNQLENKADKDATNIDVDKFVVKLNDGAKFDDTATGTRLATDADVVDVVGKTKTEIKGITDKLDERIDNLEMAAGTTEGLAKIEELRVDIKELQDEAVDADFVNRADDKVKEYVNGELAKKADKTALEAETAARAAKDIELANKVDNNFEILKEADQGLKNEIDTEKTARIEADKAINDEIAKKANAEDVYTKTESDARFVKIEGTVEEQGGTITTHTKRIEVLEKVAVNHETRIDNLEVKTDKLEKRIDSVASITAAMTTLDLGSVPVGQFGIGISFGASGKSQAVAAGLGFAPTENFKLNAKFSTSTGKERRTAVGAGAVYYLNLK